MVHSSHRIRCEPNPPSKPTKMQMRTAMLHSLTKVQVEIIKTIKAECH